MLAVRGTEADLTFFKYAKKNLSRSEEKKILLKFWILDLLDIRMPDLSSSTLYYTLLHYIYVLNLLQLCFLNITTIVICIYDCYFINRSYK